MNKFLLSLVIVFSFFSSFSQSVKKTFYFDNYNVVSQDNFQIIEFENCIQTAETGNPLLPYCSVKLLLPQGTKADNIEILGEDLCSINQEIILLPAQYSQPLSKPNSGIWAYNQNLYSSSEKYPEKQEGEVVNQYLNGYSICLSTFTPVIYNPKNKIAQFYKKVTVIVNYSNDDKSLEVLENFNNSSSTTQRVYDFVQNGEMLSTYYSEKEITDGYDILIVTGQQYVNSFNNLINFYSEKGLKTEIIALNQITTTTSGIDIADKLRNYIIEQYQTRGISYVLLGGDVDIIPYRGFYCTVQSSSVYEDDNIPSDIYFSALDGNWNTNNDNKWAEIGEEDLLPEIAVGRFSFSNATELSNMINKTLMYQQNPVLDELNNPLLAGEDLWSDPFTTGSQYLNLLIGNQTANGYETTGIPVTDPVFKLYDDINYWGASEIITEINNGHSFIHHSGHSNSDYALRLSIDDITESNFSQLNGINHNFTFVYTHGCICGAFDSNDCIAEEMVKINKFLVGFIGNSRYGWFNEGQTEGPSHHLHREFVDALYDKKISNIGMTHMVSKIETIPWVTAPGQWEEGALRWCFYECNVLGDPALSMWINNPYQVNATFENTININIDYSVNVKINNIVAQDYTCTILQNNVIIGTAKTDVSGNAVITINQDLAQNGAANLIISGYNILNTEYAVTLTDGSISNIENEDLYTSFFDIYPNPFTEKLNVVLNLDKTDIVKIEILDLTGKVLTTLINSEFLAGNYTKVFDENFSKFDAGIYFCKTTIGNEIFTKKIIKIE